MSWTVPTPVSEYFIPRQKNAHGNMLVCFLRQSDISVFPLCNGQCVFLQEEIETDTLLHLGHAKVTQQS